MELFPFEIDAGITDLKNTVSFASLINLDTTKDSVVRALSCANLDKALATNNGQIDLFYLKSVLASVGWNLNDDVFSPEEIWKARSTPEDKPFNLEHEDRIIGHITGNYLVNKNGEILITDSAPTESFDVITSSVIYKYWKDKEFQSLVEKTIAEIEAGEWFVSMECLFPKFDYAIKAPDGTERVIARTKESAFLTKHLRAYGGQGQYGEYRVGRLLKEFIFSGHGLVRKPANPASVILNNESFNGTQANLEELNLEEKNMSEEKVTELKAEVAGLQDKLAQLTTAKATELKALEVVVAEKEAELNTLKVDSEETKKELADATNRIKELETEISNQKAEAKKIEKLSKIKDSGVFSSEELEKMQAKLVALDDETLELMLEVAKSRKTEVTETVAEVEETEGHEKALEEAEEEKEVTLAVSSDESEMKRAAASLREYLKTAVTEKKRGGK